MTDDPELKKLIELLDTAAVEGAAMTVELLLLNNPKLAEVVRNGHDYPLWRAAEQGHTRIVDTLRSYGSRIASLDNIALRLAVKGGHTDTVRYLLDHGGDPSTWEHDAVWNAFSMRRADILRMLLQAGGKLKCPVTRLPEWSEHKYSPEMEHVLTEFNLWADERGRLSRAMDSLTGHERRRPEPPILFPPPKR